MNQLKKFARRSSYVLAGLLVMLLIVLGWNYLWFSSKQLQVVPAQQILWNNESLYKHFQGAIQIPTVSERPSTLTEDSPLFQFRDYLAETFPALHRPPFVRRTGVDFGDPLIPSVLLEWPGQDSSLPGILLMSHFDVVPIETNTRSEWTHEPFSGHIDGTFLWGRGTLDCKHGVMAILEAIDRHAADGFQPQRTIYVALGHDEELGGQNGNGKMAEWLRSHGRKLHMVLDEGGCIFTEFPGLDQPAALIGVAEKGMLNVQLSVEVSPTEIGHASMPPPETAVSILASAIDRVQASPFPARIDSGLRDTLRFLGPEMPSFNRRLAMANLWLTEPLIKNQLAGKPSSNALLRTTVAPTLIQGGVKANVLPQHATATLNLRLIPGDSIEEATEHLRQSIDDARVEVSPLPFGKAASRMSSTESIAFNDLHRTIREVYPEVAVAPFVLVGGTDSVHYSDFAADIYRFIPARIAERDTQRFHGIDERIALQDYTEIVRFFYQLILNQTGP
ncbi:M20/M25/M40 family metallo-hydrolase [Novipirellula rosea]|uniref:M20 family peptidase n=1 Tax=Novipirellula rosea TaxID=1031540 RepID=A0ABP8MSV4_9BACT